MDGWLLLACVVGALVLRVGDATAAHKAPKTHSAGSCV